MPGHVKVALGSAAMANDPSPSALLLGENAKEIGNNVLVPFGERSREKAQLRRRLTKVTSRQIHSWPNKQGNRHKC